MADESQDISLPTAGQIRLAIELYLTEAYEEDRPGSIAPLIPSEEFDPADYLMTDAFERTPDGTGLGEVRSFALRLGNTQYRHMKLRISRPPREAVYMFVVDAHDEFLHAPVGSPDRDALEELKRHNTAVARTIGAAWDSAGLPTEKNFLRRKIKQVRREKASGRREPRTPPPDSGGER